MLAVDAPVVAAWGLLGCHRCGRSSISVVVDDDGVIRIAGLPCPRCGAPSARWLFRGGSCATETLAVRRAEAFHAKGEGPPKRGA